MRWYWGAALFTLVGCSGADATNGEAVYNDTCATCHGANGDEGVVTDGEAAADLNVEVPQQSDSQLTNVIQNGFGKMPAQPLTDSETKDVIAYLRQKFGGSS